MPKLIDKPAKEKRVALSLTADLNDRLVTLARLKGVAPAVFARKILSDYLDEHNDLITKVKQAETTYQESLNRIRALSADE